MQFSAKSSGLVKRPPNQRDNSFADLVAALTGLSRSEVARTRLASGGCMHRAEIVELIDGRKFFVKSNLDASLIFEQEILGLEALAGASKIRIPQVVGLGALEGDQTCLILEYIEASEPSRKFFASLGHGLAETHRSGSANSFGWEHNNYLGLTPQLNSRCPDWIEFFAEFRLRAQLRIARNSRLGSDELFDLTERVIARLDVHLGGPSEQACLLHGDLWSGNCMADENGQPVIFDPAVYFGHREAELAMPLLFGGFPAEFFRAYEEAWPLQADWRRRVELYKLYHLLNHLNLFGDGYLQSCLDIVRKFQ